MSCSLNSQAQLKRLSRPVFWWALWHPFAAMKINNLKDECADIYDKPLWRVQLDTFSAGGKLDAFRHVFYMAAFTQKVKPRKIARLGRAHERANYRDFRKGISEDGEKPDSLSSVMDLHNNALGIALGCNNRHLVLRELGDLAAEVIQNGEALIFRRNEKGRYVDCSNREIDPSDHLQWYVPKCLVSSAKAP